MLVGSLFVLAFTPQVRTGRVELERLPAPVRLGWPSLMRFQEVLGLLGDDIRDDVRTAAHAFPEVVVADPCLSAPGSPRDRPACPADGASGPVAAQETEPAHDEARDEHEH